MVAARLDWEQRGANASEYGDGLLTGADTFQKYFSQEELRGWIDGTLNARSVAAAPGVFYVFRRQDAAQRLLASQIRGRPRRQGIAELLYQHHTETLRPLEAFAEAHRRLPGPAELPNSQQLIEEFGSIRAAFSLIRRVTGKDRWHDVDLGRPRTSEQRFEQNLPILQPLIDFATERGRLPRPGELTDTSEIDNEFGSVRAAFSLIRRVTPPGLWAASEQTGRDNTLVYLALAAFAGRPRLRELPDDLQYDIKDFHGTYKTACAQADQLLYTLADQNKLNQACSQAPLGSSPGKPSTSTATAPTTSRRFYGSTKAAPAPSPAPSPKRTSSNSTATNPRSPTLPTPTSTATPTPPSPPPSPATSPSSGSATATTSTRPTRRSSTAKKHSSPTTTPAAKNSRASPGKKNDAGSSTPTPRSATETTGTPSSPNTALKTRGHQLTRA